MIDTAGIETEKVHLDQDNPWPGPDSFLEEHAAYFCGRNEEVEQLLRMVHAQSLTVLYGLSGLGKTSLLQAGLFPLLRREGFLPVLIRLRYQEGEEEPTQQVKDALVKACESSNIDAPIPRRDETLWEYFDPLRPRLVNRRGRPIVPILIFDQFEELFTLGRETDAREQRYQRFVTEMANLIENRKPASVAARERTPGEDAPREQFSEAARSCRVIISLRADYLYLLEHFVAQQIPTLGMLRQRFGLRHMNGEQAHKAILEAGGHLVAPHVADRIVRVVAAKLNTEGETAPLAKLRVEPAILSIFCRELNERRKAMLLPNITEDLVHGTREEILDQFYERAFEVVPGESRPRVRAFVEDRLLTKAGHRNSMLVDEAVESPGLNRKIIDGLVNKKLLRIEDLGEGRRSLEITHDVLANVARISRDRRTKIEADAETARIKAEADAENARIKDEAAEERRRNFNRLLLMAGATAVALCLAILSIVAMLIAHTAEGKEQEALAQNVKTLGQGATANAAGDDPTGALPTLTQVVRIIPSGETSNPLLGSTLRATTISLMSALLQYSYPLPKTPVISFGEKISASAVSPDGRWLVLGGSLGQAKVYDLAHFPAQDPVTLQQPGNQEIIAIALCPQTRAAATLSADGELRVWSMDSGKDLRGKIQLQAFGADISRPLAFTGDGKYLFTSDSVKSSDSYQLDLIDPSSDLGPLTLGRSIKIDGIVPYPDDGDHRVLAYGAEKGSVGLVQIVDGDKFSQPTDITASIDDGSKNSRFLVQATVHDVSLDVPLEIFTLEKTDASMNGTGVERWNATDGTRLGSELDDVVADQLMMSPNGAWEAELSESQQSGGIATQAEFNFVGQSNSVRTPRLRGEYDLAAFSPDSRLFCMGSRAGNIQIWSLAGEHPVKFCEPLDLGVELASLNFLPDSQTLAVVTKSGKITLWDVRPRAANPFIIPHDSAVRFAAFLGNGDYLTIDGEGGAKITPAHRGTANVTALNPGASVETAALCDQAGLVLVAIRNGDNGLSAYLWNMKTGKVGKTVPLDHDGDTGDPIMSTERILMDPAGAWVLTLSNRRDARLWHIHPDDATLEADPAFEKQALQGYALGRAGGDLLVLGMDGKEYRWNIASASLDGTPKQVHSGQIVDAQFSRDGSEVAVISDTQLDVCSTASGICRGQTDFTSDPKDTSFALSPDGKRLATASHSVLRLWDVDQSKFVTQPILLAGTQFCLQFSEDGSEVLVGGQVADSEDSDIGPGFVQAWDAEQGWALTKAIPCKGAVRCGAFSPDGSQLIAGAEIPAPSGAVGEARVWILAPPGAIPKNHPLLDLAETIALGKTVEQSRDQSGTNRSDDRFHNIQDLRQSLQQLSANGDAYANIGLWLTEPDLTDHDRAPTDPPP
jgi:WD40 repeat protein